MKKKSHNFPVLSKNTFIKNRVTPEEILSSDRFQLSGDTPSQELNPENLIPLKIKPRGNTILIKTPFDEWQIANARTNGDPIQILNYILVRPGELILSQEVGEALMIENPNFSEIFRGFRFNKALKDVFFHKVGKDRVKIKEEAAVNWTNLASIFMYLSSLKKRDKADFKESALDF